MLTIFSKDREMKTKMSAILVLVLGLVSNVGGQIATNPSPADGATDVPLDVMLSWDLGAGSSASEVYFGDSYDEVDAGAVNTFKGLVVQETFSPGRLTPDTTYYWRIDGIAPPISTEAIFGDSRRGQLLPTPMGMELLMIWTTAH
jgi:hypothetical protein